MKATEFSNLYETRLTKIQKELDSIFFEIGQLEEQGKLNDLSSYALESSDFDTKTDSIIKTVANIKDKANKIPFHHSQNGYGKSITKKVRKALGYTK